ncbi:MAG: glycosyltransferase family 2 protein [Planctomycetes bacterium]|nr:glycosyltransferase family 2 protein [Planctomycetota bacterium]
MNARVVIPTWNAGPALAELLRRLRAQQPGGIVSEIVVFDSSSTDGTAELAAREGATVTRIAKSEFNHGATRARAAAGAKTEFVIFMVQDALPENEHFARRLLEPFADARVAGTYARVVARADASALVRRDVSRDPAAGGARLYKYIYNRADYDERSAFDRRVFCHFNNVASAVRRADFERLSFRPLPFGEDLDFGKRALEAGRAIVYVPDAVVEHSHASGVSGDFGRHRDDAAIEKLLFGIVKPRSFAGAFARAARLIFDDAAGSPPVFAPMLRLAQSLGRWRGGKVIFNGKY